MKLPFYLSLVVDKKDYTCQLQYANSAKLQVLSSASVKIGLSLWHLIEFLKDIPPINFFTLKCIENNSNLSVVIFNVQ